MNEIFIKNELYSRMEEALENGTLHGESKDLYLKMKDGLKDELAKAAGNDTIFCMRIRDAWQKELLKMRVNDKKLIIEIKCSRSEFDIDIDASDRIREIVKGYSSKITSDEIFIEPNNIYDGYDFNIMMTDGETAFYGDVLDNIDEQRSEKYPNALLLNTVIDEILAVLDEQNIDINLSEMFRKPSTLIKI